MRRWTLSGRITTLCLCYTLVVVAASVFGVVAAAHGQSLAEMAVAVAVFVGVISALLVWMLRGIVAKPVARLAAQVHDLAGGDYADLIDAKLTGNRGPPEVVVLGQGLDELRRLVVDDLTAVTAARAALEQANRQLERQATELVRSNRDLEQFASVASRDLQEPLRKVASSCQLLQRRYAGKLDERADQYIALAVDGAHRMQRLVNALLAFAQIGHLPGGMVLVSMDAVVAAVVATFDDVLRAGQGVVSWGRLPTVIGDEALLRELLTSLIGNSVKFRRSDPPVRVEISARPAGTDWEMTVADNGIGIDVAYAEHVFLMFGRVHAREAYPGSGIGLTVARRIVEYHGGRIWVDTTAVGGATVRFTLPGETRENRTADIPTQDTGIDPEVPAVPAV